MVFQNLKLWLDIFELLIDGISPESISILVIKYVSLINSFRNMDAEIVSMPPVPGLDFVYSTITPYERV